MSKGMKRRDFFKVAGLSGAGVAAAGCSPDPVEDLIPMLVPPDDTVPGVPYNFASLCQECAAQCGVIVKTREGRAIKVEGNPNHPMNQGALCAKGHASLQALYNPARVKEPFKNGKLISEKNPWEFAKKELATQIKFLRAEGKGSRVYFMGSSNSGTYSQLVDDFISAIGGERIKFDLSPVNSIKMANQLLFGRNEIPKYEIGKAKILINFGADFLESWLNGVENTKGYSEMHAIKGKSKGRFVHVSSYMSLTGTNSDQWIKCPSGAEATLALVIASELFEKANHIPPREQTNIKEYLQSYSLDSLPNNLGVKPSVIANLVKEFGTKGRGLAIGGGNSAAGQQSTELQIAIHLLNYIGGAVGKTLLYGANYQLGGDSQEKINRMISRMNNGETDVVILDRINPVYAIPHGSGFKEALKKVKTVLALDPSETETTRVANYHLPVSETYESWGDSNTRTGVYGLQQPAMAKLPGYQTIGSGDLLLQISQLAGISVFKEATYLEYLKTAWKKIQIKVRNYQSFETFWKSSLQNGGVFKNFQSSTVRLRTQFRKHQPSQVKVSDSLTLLAVNSNFHDANGRTGDKPWLLEIPHPVTQIVWDSWVEIHPETAKKHGIRHGDEVNIKTKSGSAKVGVFVYHGIAENTLVMPTGLGQTVPFPSYSSRRHFILPPTPDKPNILKSLRVGMNVMSLLDFDQDTLSGDFVFQAQDVQIKSTGKKAQFVSVDGQFRDDIKALQANSTAGEGDRGQKGTGLIQRTSLENLRKGIKEEYGHHLKKRHYKTNTENPSSFYQTMPDTVEKHAFELKGKQTPKYYDPYKWEMVIDLDRCTGCSSCVVACYSENNVPVVGKERMSVGREMSWIRIERFFDYNEVTGEVDTNYAPEMCNQCSNAGCEAVCPVYATYHSPEGLNAQIYNRCVGTRYCSNNCIYKQRRFNWRSYEFPKPLHMQLNPDVTVRDKGVMEKCTFCVQRIQYAKDLAKDGGNTVKDGEILTACQQACPSDAITFGNAKDPKSKLSMIKNQTDRTYHQLEEVGFKPSITYLRKVTHSKIV